MWLHKKVHTFSFSTHFQDPYTTFQDFYIVPTNLSLWLVHVGAVVFQNNKEVYSPSFVLL